MNMMFFSLSLFASATLLKPISTLNFPAWLRASGTVQEVLVDGWLARAAGLFDRGGDRRFLHRYPRSLSSLRSFPFLILVGFRQRPVDSLCFPTHPLRVPVAKTGESFFAVQSELRPRLFAWVRCPPLPCCAGCSGWIFGGSGFRQPR